MEQATDEIGRLKACISDLLDILALPALWRGGEPSQIVGALQDMLLGMLRLDFAYARLSDPAGGLPIETLRFAQDRAPTLPAHEIGRMLEPSLRDFPYPSPLLIPNPMGSGDVSIVPLRFGLQDEMGVFVAACGRADFPTQTERLVLTVAANLATSGLCEARRMSDQTRAALELDQRVTQRSGELLVVNEDLNKEIAEHRRTEAALRASESRFRSLTELSSDWYWEQDENLRIKFLSRETHELTGYSADSSLGKTVWELKGITPLSTSWAEHKAVLAARQSFRDFECSRTAPDGSIRYLSISGTPIYDEQGNFNGYRGTGRNITERKRAEAALHEGEERFRRMADAIPEVIWFTALEPEKVLYCSPSFERIWGVPVDDLYQNPRLWTDKIHLEDRERVIGTYSRWIAGEQPVYDGIEYRIIQSNGAIRWIHERGVLSLNEDGRAFLASGISTDITERKNIEEELRRSQHYLAEAQRLSHIGSWAFNAAGFGYWSPELFKIHGLHPGGKAPSIPEYLGLVHPEDRDFVAQEIEKMLAGAEGFDFKKRIVRTDGAIRHVRCVGIRATIGGIVQEFVGTGMDVTEQERAEEELRRLERQLRLAQRLEAVGTLAGGIAHDFNNILGVILGYGEMALRGAPKGSRLQRDIGSIMTAGERGRALVDRVLAFSRSSVGERVAVHVEGVVREALDLLEAKLPAGIRVEANLRAGRAAILGDPTQVHQVLMNLGTNAVQAMPSGGTLSVSLVVARFDAERPSTTGIVAAGEYVVLTVSDSGVGIPRAIIDRIFDPFFTTKEVGTGTGLGLSLVHGIVAQFGGAIDVASTPGQGSEFTIYLPRSGDADETRDDRGAPAMPRGGGQRVLIVDDEEPLVSLATRTLEDLGYLPAGFISCAAALEAFRADPVRFDVVITDERMPGMSGTALIREVRRLRPTIPVLLMSGYLGGAVASGAREVGADEVLMKPLSARELAASLARVLHQR